MPSGRLGAIPLQAVLAQMTALLKPYLAEACVHYEDEETAWALSDWLNKLGPRLDGLVGKPVTFVELQFAISLYNPDAPHWAEPTRAQEHLYRLIAQIGDETTSVPTVS